MEVLKTMISYEKNSVTEESLQRIKLRSEAELAVKLFEKMMPDQWYRVRLSFKNMEHFEMLRYTTDDSDPWVWIARVDLDAIPERVVAYRSPETQFLPPEKSFRQKLKNCVKYLRHKSGGRLEERQKNAM